MDKLHELVVRHMARTLRTLEKAVPAPQLVEIHGRKAYRFVEKTVHQAVVLKLARLVSALQAARALFANGLLQDVGATQRIIDEVNEDIALLCFAITRNEMTKLHERFLAEFWQEEFDGPTAMTSSQKRDRVAREKVRGYLASVEGGEQDQSTRISTYSVIAKAYSGYVHGASTHIMEMYFGEPLALRPLQGINSPLRRQQEEDLQNHFLRGICSFGLAAAAFGSNELLETIMQFRNHYEEQTGMDFDVKELKKALARNRRGESNK